VKFKGTYQLVVCADYNFSSESVHTVKKITEAISVASKESGLEVNAEELTIYSSPVNRRQDGTIT
jgi:hypothetical protein